MSTPPLGITNFGAFTLLTAKQIQAALQAAGFGTPGNVYYLNPANGNDNGPGTSPNQAFATLAAGYAALSEGNNDVLVLVGNGLSTGSARLSAGFTWAKDAAHLIGICAPSAISQRARIAPFTGAGQAAFANFFTVSGNGCLFSNLSLFHGFTAGIAAAICLTVTGQRNAFINCDIEGMGDTTSATDAGSRCILLNGGGENYFYHCNIGLDTVERTGANASVELKAATARNYFEACTFPFWSSDGLQYGILAAAAAALDRWVLLKGCNAIATNAGGGTAEAAFFHLAATAGGIACFDATSGLFNFTAIGDATSKAQIFVSGGTATNGVKGVVAT